MKNLVVIDIETSGLNPHLHEVLAIALVPLSDDIAPLEVFIKYDKIAWQEYSYDLFEKYRSAWQDHSCPPKIALSLIEEYIKKSFEGKKITLVGHNVSFDTAFLRKLVYLASNKVESDYIAHRSIDTHTLLHTLVSVGAIPDTTLSSTGAFEYFDIPVSEKERHTALGDAIATKKLYNRLLDMFQDCILAKEGLL